MPNQSQDDAHLFAAYLELVDESGVLPASLHLPVDLPWVALRRNEADRLALTELHPCGYLGDLDAVRAQICSDQLKLIGSGGPQTEVVYGGMPLAQN